VGMLPWTDRIFCETLPLIDETLEAPWATVEFDSAFMTLHRERVEGSDETRVAGVMGRTVNQERLWLPRPAAQGRLGRQDHWPLGRGHHPLVDPAAGGPPPHPNLPGHPGLEETLMATVGSGREPCDGPASDRLLGGRCPARGRGSGDGCKPRGLGPSFA
jgi:hypothetical protein